MVHRLGRCFQRKQMKHGGRDGPSEHNKDCFFHSAIASYGVCSTFPGRGFEFRLQLRDYSIATIWAYVLRRSDEDDPSQNTGSHYNLKAGQCQVTGSG